MIEKANSNTEELNILLKYIDYFSKPEQILNQYGSDVCIGDIKDELIIAFNKLDLYLTLIASAVRVTSA